MYTCHYACVDVSQACMYVRYVRYVHVHMIYVHVQLHLHACMYITYVTYARKYMSMYVCMYVHMYVRTYACMHARLRRRLALNSGACLIVCWHLHSYCPLSSSDCMHSTGISSETSGGSQLIKFSIHRSLNVSE